MSLSPEPRRTPEEVPPHTPLTTYYGKDEERERYVQDLFDRSAHHYNTIEAIFLNGGLWYRRFSLRRAGLARGMKVLDVAMGTAAVARGAAKLVGTQGFVVGVDPNRHMIREGRRVFHGPVARGVAERLPFASGNFDFVTMGIALRHVADLVGTFREYRRMLKPGGKVWILEGHAPSSGVGRALTKLVWARAIPGLTYLFTRSRDAKLLMDYYWDTVEKCVPPDTIVRALGEAGFEDAKCQVVVPGAFCEYTARNPGLS